KQAMKQALQAKDLDELRGIEGMAAKRYFEAFPALFGAGGFASEVRGGPPPKNPATPRLNYGYALLRAELTGALQAAGLDPYIGFLHRERYGRESLALDVMEEFRSILVDNLVVKVINQGMIQPDDFTFDLGEPRLKDSAR